MKRLLAAALVLALIATAAVAALRLSRPLPVRGEVTFTSVSVGKDGSTRLAYECRSTAGSHVWLYEVVELPDGARELGGGGSSYAAATLLDRLLPDVLGVTDSGSATSGTALRDGQPVVRSSGGPVVRTGTAYPLAASEPLTIWRWTDTRGRTHVQEIRVAADPFDAAVVGARPPR